MKPWVPECFLSRYFYCTANSQFSAARGFGPSAAVTKASYTKLFTASVENIGVGQLISVYLAEGGVALVRKITNKKALHLAGLFCAITAELISGSFYC